MITNDKVAILEASILEELVSELAYLRLMIGTDVKSTIRNLNKINKNLDKTIDNFDVVLASKVSEVMQEIDVESIQEQVIERLMSQFDSSIKDVNHLSDLARGTSDVIDKFEQNYSEIEKILDTYDRRINSTKVLSIFVSLSVVTSAFVLGTIYPFLLLKI